MEGEGKWVEGNTDMQVESSSTSEEKEKKEVTNEKLPESNAANVVVSNITPLVSSDFLARVQEEMAKSSVTTINTERAETIALRKELDDWRAKNSFAELHILNIQDGPEYTISAAIGPESIPFQLYAKENWLPLFVLSESPLLSEYIDTINMQIDEKSKTAAPITIANLLSLLSNSFNIPKPVPTANRNFFTNFNLPKDGDEEEEKVTPTMADWDSIILPEIKKALEKENFQKYEVDEWLRRIQLQLQRGNMQKALSLVQDDILGGALPPKTISKFFPRFRWRNRPKEEDEEKQDSFIEVGGNSETTAKIKSELKSLKEMNSKELGFKAQPIHNDIYHLQVSLFGFGNSQLGQDLEVWSLQNTTISDQMKEIEQDIQLELKFPSDYPARPPYVRIIKPRFQNLELELNVLSTSGTISNANNDVNMTDAQAEGRKSLSVSRVLEKSKDSWTPVTITELLQQIRSFFLESGAKIDMESPQEGYSLPTIGGFWRTFKSCNAVTGGKPELENSGKIIMPVTALEELSQFDLENTNPYISSPFVSTPPNNNSLQSSPILFELSTGKGKRSFCGVEEFTAEEGSIVVPQWILNNLQVSQGSELEVRRVQLPRATYVKLQPHTADFLEVNDTKAMLEWVLPKFVVLSVGDTIVVPYREKKYSFNVLEVKPGRAVHIVDSEVNTEFAPPLSGEVPISSTASMATTPTKKMETTTPQGTPNNNVLGRVEGGVEGVDFKICDNCKQRIPVGVFTTHSLTCARMNWFCDVCQMVVQKIKKEEHMNEFHKLVVCECGASMEARYLSSHKLKECPKRIARCQYCELQMPFEEIREHETKCGSQTEKCAKCNRYIQRKDLPIHVVECEEPKPSWYNRPSSSPIRSPSRNFRPPSPPQKRSGEEVLLCPVCMEPFVHLDDLQVHMLSSHEGSMDNPTPIVEEKKEEIFSMDEDKLA